MTAVAERSAGRSHPWRDNLEAMTMAIVMALLLKGFVVEAYKIPTGSMQPTLIGDEDSGIQDRILVDKLSYVLGDPQRWDVAVFRYPLNRSQNFVKRIVGVGPEEFRIHNGDLWNRSATDEPWSVLRRPRSVQESTWLRLDVAAPEGSSWHPDDEATDWSAKARSVRARGTGKARFRSTHSTIQDRYFDGYPEEILPYMEEAGGRKRGANPVGDLRLTGQVAALPGARWIELILTEGNCRYTFRVPGPEAPEGARPTIVPQAFRSLGPKTPEPIEAAATWRLTAGRPVHFLVQNLDDLLTFEVDGAFALELEIPTRYDQASSVQVGVDGEGADFSDLMVYRDIYYRAEGRTQSVTIPDGHYFMLGDNTRNSSDSREWFFDVFEVRDPAGGPSRTLRANGGVPGRERAITQIDGRRHRRLTDAFGETAWYADDDIEDLGQSDEPFVARDQVLGKALAVFWPLDLRRDIYRFQWVH